MHVGKGRNRQSLWNVQHGTTGPYDAAFSWSMTAKEEEEEESKPKVDHSD